MEIILDCREKKLYDNVLETIKKNDIFCDIIVKTQNLNIGDIFINYNGITKLIIERKTITDLISSIKDKRYEEQSFRLNDINYHNHNIIYLIEGSIEKYGKNKQMIYSSIFSLNYYKGFSVYRSIDIQDTSYIICNMIYKIHNDKDKNRKSYYSFINNIEGIEKEEEQENKEKQNKDYCGLITKKRNSQITQENISEIMLCQIPGISNISAIEILKHFDGDISKLIYELKENPNCLYDISYITENNKTRKINKKSIDNILKYLLKTL